MSRVVSRHGYKAAVRPISILRAARRRLKTKVLFVFERASGSRSTDLRNQGKDRQESSYNSDLHFDLDSICLTVASDLRSEDGMENRLLDCLRGLRPLISQIVCPLVCSGPLTNVPRRLVLNVPWIHKPTSSDGGSVRGAKRIPLVSHTSCQAMSVTAEIKLSLPGGNSVAKL